MTVFVLVVVEVMGFDPARIRLAEWDADVSMLVLTQESVVVSVPVTMPDAEADDRWLPKVALAGGLLPANSVARVPFDESKQVIGVEVVRCTKSDRAPPLRLSRKTSTKTVPPTSFA